MVIFYNKTKIIIDDTPSKFSYISTVRRSRVYIYIYIYIYIY